MDERVVHRVFKGGRGPRPFGSDRADSSRAVLHDSTRWCVKAGSSPLSQEVLAVLMRFEDEAL